MTRGGLYHVRHPGSRDPKRARVFVVVSRQALIAASSNSSMLHPCSLKGKFTMKQQLSLLIAVSVMLILIQQRIDDQFIKPIRPVPLDLCWHLKNEGLIQDK